jgi:hypothetical protein
MQPIRQQLAVGSNTLRVFPVAGWKYVHRGLMSLPEPNIMYGCTLTKASYRLDGIHKYCHS